MRPILSLFRRERAEPPATVGSLVLPVAVCDAIDVASLVVRPGGEKSQARVVCQFEGRTGFIFTPEGAPKVLADLFPDLNERQLGQAVLRLRSRAKACLRGLELGDPETIPWIRRY